MFVGPHPEQHEIELFIEFPLEGRFHPRDRFRGGLADFEER